MQQFVDPLGHARPVVEEVADAVQRVGVSLPPSGTGKPAKARSRTRIQYGREDHDLAAVPQLVDAAQTQAIAHALDRIGDLLDDRAGMPERIDELLHRIDEKGLDWLSPTAVIPGTSPAPPPRNPGSGQPPPGTPGPALTPSPEPKAG